MKIVLAVKHQGHVPSFKNCKRAVRKGKHATIITEPETKKWMERCIQGFESQLFCGSATTADGMPTAQHRHSSIVSSLPLDDSRQWIPELHVVCEEVCKGDEGAVIIIEEITNV